MTMYERGYRTGLRSPHVTSPYAPCPVTTGEHGYLAWHDGYRDGRKVTLSLIKYRTATA